MELNVHPNPADRHIIVVTGRPEPSAFRMFDFLGRMVMATEVTDQQRLGVEHLEPGLYYYKLTAGSRLQTGKLRIRPKASG